ncbi:MAG: acyltransferase, partial [Oxalobacteraceae bacterium]
KKAKTENGAQKTKAADTTAAQGSRTIFVKNLPWSADEAMLNDFFSYIRMPIFFAVSGFLARDVIKKSFHELFDRRLIQLIYVFLLWSFIALLLDSSFASSPVSIVSDITTVFFQPSSVLWFLWALIIYMAIAKIGRATSPALFLTLSIAIAVASYARVFHFELYVYNNVFRFLPFFLIGAYRSQWLLRIPSKFTAAAIIPVVILFAAGFLVLRRDLLPPAFDNGGRFAMASLGVLVGALVSVWACRWQQIKLIPLYLGRHTLPIYVAHSLLVGPLAAGIARIAPESVGVEIWAVPVIAVAATATSLLIKFAADRAGFGWLYRRPDWLQFRAVPVPST